MLKFDVIEKQLSQLRLSRLSYGSSSVYSGDKTTTTLDQVLDAVMELPDGQ